jgi:hypothetical protein
LAAAAKTPGVVAGNDLLVAEQTAAAANGQVAAASNNLQAARDALRGVTQRESYLEIGAPLTELASRRSCGFYIGAGWCAAHRANRKPESFPRGKFLCRKPTRPEFKKVSR